jgi:predicted  nucleic acid-binding Zn-ribbon protein
MHEMELLDRALMSLQKTEEAYTDVNNRIIEAVNQRKERLNNLNNRILGISQKIVTLYGVNSAMRIVSPAHFPDVQKANGNKQTHPHQSIFFDQVTYQDPVDTAQQNLPELSSIRLNKKMFNNRLKNNPEDLKKLVRGAKEDIQTISKLVKTMSTYRSQFGDVRGILQNQKSNLGTSAASKD